jgi:DNA-binding transcriptional ArsR family regulator
MGDPTRARMLSRLLDGRHYTAKELAECADVTAATASVHLRLLVDQQLASVRSQGRHKYFKLADANVAHALEALMRVADGLMPETARWLTPSMRPLRYARSCYGHLAGELGVRLCNALIQNAWVAVNAKDEQFYEVTAFGDQQLKLLGLTEDQRALKGKRPLYGCVDWSERKEHFAGPLAVELFETMIAKGWLKRDEKSRAIFLTLSGKRSALGEILDLNSF